MKLRNKETGEIFEIISFDYINSTKPNGNGDYPVEFIYLEGIDEVGDNYEFKYKSLKDLNAMWEDYKPAEPLIKDEKIRKAVRAWAEVNKFGAEYVVKYYLNTFSLNSWQADIEFNTHIEGLKDGEEYAIAELCG